MKIAILTDQHFGVRNDNVAFYDYQAKFYREVVLPYIDANDIKVVWDGGDTFDRRKYINFHSLKAAKDMWFDELRTRNVQLYTIVGNHTAYYKNTNEVNTMELLFADYENMHIVSEAKTLNFDGLDVAFLFHKVLYDDVNKTMEEVIEQDFSGFSNSFVKLIVRNKTNPYWFDIVVDKIEKTGVLDLQIVEDHLNLDLEDDADIVDEAEDTLTIMRKFVAQYLPETEQTMAKDLNNLLTELYQEALSAEREA